MRLLRVQRSSPSGAYAGQSSLLTERGMVGVEVSAS
jgi:hypothetical protein